MTNLPGGGRGSFEWIGEPPLYWKIIFWVMVAQFSTGWILLASLPHWASSSPNPVHPVEIRMKGGHTYYLPPRLGWYLNNDLWIFFGLFLLRLLIMFIHREQVRRVR